MFRESAAIREGARMRRFASEFTAYRRTHDQWFDGTVGSCDKRLAKIDSLLTQVHDSGLSASAGRLQSAGLLLRRHQASVTDLRDQMLSAAPERMQAAGRGFLARLTAAQYDSINIDARNFVAAAGVDDADELVYRARRYAGDKTSAMPPARGRMLTEAFVERVAQLAAAAPRPRREASVRCATVEDFDDSLLSL